MDRLLHAHAHEWQYVSVQCLPNDPVSNGLLFIVLYELGLSFSPVFSCIVASHLRWHERYSYAMILSFLFTHSAPSIWMNANMCIDPFSNKLSIDEYIFVFHFQFQAALPPNSRLPPPICVSSKHSWILLFICGEMNIIPVFALKWNVAPPNGMANGETACMECMAIQTKHLHVDILFSL